MNASVDTRHKSRRISSFSLLLLMGVLVLLGAISIPFLRVQYAPDTSSTSLTVRFSYPSASPRIVEQEVSSKIEGLLSTLRQVSRTSSVSSQSGGYVTAQFKAGTPMDEARFEVSSLLRNLYSELPKGVSYPSLSLTTTGEVAQRSMMTYTFLSTLPTYQMAQFIEHQVLPVLSRIQGVERISLQGITPQAWHLSFDAKKILIAGIHPEAIAQVLSRHFVETSLEQMVVDVNGSKHSMEVKLSENPQTPLENLPLLTADGHIYRMRDFVTLKYQEIPPTSYDRINGLNTIYLTLYAAPHTRLTDIGRTVQQQMKILSAQFPAEISATLFSDGTATMKNHIHKMYVRTLLCLLILLLLTGFISRSLRYLSVIFISILTNMLMAFGFFYLLDIPIHLYTLAAISVSLSLVIDTSIIMIDACSTYQMRSIRTSVLGALWTTLGALSVIFTLPESTRQSLSDFAWVLILYLCLALLIALIFIPALLEKIPLYSGLTQMSWSMKKRSVTGLQRYGQWIAWSQRYRWCFIVMAIWAFGLPLFLLPTRILPSQPQSQSAWQRLYNHIQSVEWIDQHRLSLNKILGGSLYGCVRTSRASAQADRTEKILTIQARQEEEGTIQQLNELIRSMENYLSSFSEIKRFETQIHSHREGLIQVSFFPEYEQTAFPRLLRDKIVIAARQFGGATWNIYGIDENGFSNQTRQGYKSHHIRLTGYQYERLLRYAEQWIDSLETNPRVTDAAISSSKNVSEIVRTAYEMKYRSESLALQSIQVSDFYQALRKRIYHQYVGNDGKHAQPEDYYLVSSENESFDLWQMKHEPLGWSEHAIKGTQIGELSPARSEIDIHKTNQSYQIYIGYNFIGSQEMAQRTLDKYLQIFNDNVFPIGFKAYDDQTSRSQMGSVLGSLKTILLVVGIIYVICALLFESLTLPLVVISLIPCSFIGVFLAFSLLKIPFDKGGFAALILLCGIVVNAGIYLIYDIRHTARNGHKQGLALYLKAFSHKIVPILLTLLTTIMGLVPFLLDGPQEEFWFSFAAGTMGGGFFSGLALLFYFPLFYRTVIKLPPSISKKQFLPHSLPPHWGFPGRKADVSKPDD